MEWSKTKSIMIIALVITNLIVGYFYWQEFSLVSGLSSREQLKALEEILLRNQINIEYLTPIEIEILPRINLILQEIDRSSYHIEGYVISMENNHTVLLTKDKKTSIPKGNPPNSFVGSNQDEILVSIQNWLLNNLNLENDFAVVNALETDDGYIINYGQVYEGYFIDGSFMSVHVVDGQVMRFQRRWYAVEEIKDQSLSLCSYHMALYRLLDVVQEKRKSIETLELESVNIGYKLESNAFDTTIESGEGSPYFRFKAKNGEIFLVEALGIQ